MSAKEEIAIYPRSLANPSVHSCVRRQRRQISLNPSVWCWPTPWCLPSWDLTGSPTNRSRKHHYACLASRQVTDGGFTMRISGLDHCFYCATASGSNVCTACLWFHAGSVTLISRSSRGLQCHFCRLGSKGSYPWLYYMCHSINDKHTNDRLLNTHIVKGTKGNRWLHIATKAITPKLTLVLCSYSLDYEYKDFVQHILQKIIKGLLK